MGHDCDDCGQEFDTLSGLRLHDCPAEESDEESESDETDDQIPQDIKERDLTTVQVPQLDDQLESVTDGDTAVLYQAIATYEGGLESAKESDNSEQYRGIRNGYKTRLVNELDAATQEEGWDFLEGFIDAYSPETGDAFPHVTTVLLNVTGRNLIRTRLSEGIETIPVGALEYAEDVRLEVNDYQDTILEGLHPYGWGIGHPEFDVAENIHAHASKEIFSTQPMLEHTFYADQHQAIDLLERIARDDSIDEELSLHVGETMNETAYLLGAVASALSDEYWPTIPRYWDWEAEAVSEFELETDVKQRARDLMDEQGVDTTLTTDWEFDDLLMR